MPGFMTIAEEGLTRIIGGGKKILQLQPQVRKNFLAELGAIHGDTTIRDAHVITGRTRGSFHVSQFTDKFIEFEAMWGAKWEERRGGDHALMTHGINAARKQASPLAQQYYTDLIQSQIGIGGTGTPKKRQTTYISKYMKSGRWVYKY